jgi:tetratricopeptide (TPR) repeat protein
VALHPEELAREEPATAGRVRGVRGPRARSGRIAAWLGAALRESPATLLALGALALFVAWATDHGGYPLTMWAPGGLIVLGLLAAALIAQGGGVDAPRAAPSRACVVALAGLAAYTAFSFLSIVWAGAPGEAWEGADRTLLYLLVFALFALARLRARSAALLLVVWTLAIAGVAAYTLVHLGSLGAAGLRVAFTGGRLTWPVGYVNAEAAQWMLAAWPALLLARGATLHPVVRGLLAGAAVLLTDVALLSLSRGAVLASAIVLVLVLAFLPGRIRTFVALVPVALGIALSTPAILRVGDRLEGGTPTGGSVGAAESAIAGASTAIFAAAAAVAVAFALAAALDRAPGFSGPARVRARRALAWIGAAALLAVLAGGLVAVGNPVARVRHEWDTFKSPKGYASNGKNTNRLVGGLGSNRYDFYRVAVDEFAAHPLLGIGADNFSAQYLRRGRSSETPRYPHSVELRTLTETGTAGTLLALGGLLGALIAAGRALRRAGPLERTVAAAAIGGFAYWFVHGSADWFFEYAGLGAPAFALLGIACGLDPGGRRGAARTRLARPAALWRGGPRPSLRGPRPPARGPRLPARLRARAPHASKESAMGSARMRGLVRGAAAALATIAAAGALLLPWISAIDVTSAAHVWVASPSAAYARLDDAAALDPLSAEPDLVAGSIALRLGQLGAADDYFARALVRAPEDQYATLERGAIASQRGESARALTLLRRAVALYPRDELSRQALAVAASGRRVDVAQLNHAILERAREL